MKRIENTKKVSRADSVYKKIRFFSVFESLSSLHEKKIGNQFSLWSNLEKVKMFTAEVACLINSTILQTDSVVEMNWLTSKLQSWNSLLEKLIFFENLSSLWNELKLLNREPIQYIRKFDFFQFFEAWVACMKRKIGNHFCLWNNLENWKVNQLNIACLKTWTFLQTNSVYEMNWLPSKIQNPNSFLGKLKFFSNWSSLWKELNYFKNSYIK